MISTATDQANGIPREYEVFVGGLSIQTTEESLQTYMQRFGPVVSTRIKKFNGKSRGFAYIVFRSHETAKQVVEADHSLDNKTFSCNYYVPDGLAQKKVKDEKNRKLFVNSLPPLATESDLLLYFQEFGPVERVTLNKFVDGKSKKSAFVLFESETTAKRLLRRRHTTDHKIQGKKIYFYQSLTKKEIYEFSTKKNNQSDCLQETGADYCTLDDQKDPNSSSTSDVPDKGLFHSTLTAASQCFLPFGSLCGSEKGITTDSTGQRSPASTTASTPAPFFKLFPVLPYENSSSIFGLNHQINFSTASTYVSTLTHEVSNHRFNLGTIAPYLLRRDN